MQSLKLRQLLLSIAACLMGLLLLAGVFHPELGTNLVDYASSQRPPKMNATTTSRNMSSSYEKACGKSSVFYDLESALKDRASDDGTIILAGLVDAGYIDLGVNLHISSIVPHNICNILYIAVDPHQIGRTQEYDMPVYFHQTNLSHNLDIFGTEGFRNKTIVKLDVTYLALKMGYKVLLTDLDLFFRHNPIPFIKCGDDCDFAAQNNSYGKFVYNSGFIFLKNNERTKQFYRKMTKEAMTTSADDQNLFNGVQWKIPGLKGKFLDSDVFCVGLTDSRPSWEDKKTYEEWDVAARVKVHRPNNEGSQLSDENGTINDVSTYKECGDLFGSDFTRQVQGREKTNIFSYTTG
ncbi:hypothetical protein CAPTEDRAFT_218110 [Capitella teleta]|uniref:Nucleotide-diphospho-sugar transferase domain-containing protein n=1 Tax=Capitella teleta TaxID=283909 RepID=R7UE46_CAPTE|nr:hypothetical protein CAPTEDRAFT_218110 [Capitella teleta]|eukprot:ELU02053.1 hypothetical protein CAPTEDRAFT_218110 [Capitella teleta]